VKTRPQNFLAKGREAYARHDWADALDFLLSADKTAALDPEDLERQAWAAGMLDRDAEVFSACERLYSAHLGAGQEDRAAYWAFFGGFRLLALREHGQASAWLQRAKRLVERSESECAASGYLLLPEIQKAAMAGDWIAAALLAAQAATIGESCSDADLVSFAKCAHGRALIQQADVEEGLAKLDEAMLPAIAGELTPIVTGLIYCQLIAACRQIYAFDRSREWTEALGRWCGAQPQMVQFNGICRVHRAELLEMSGSWRDAIAEARSAAVSAARAIGDETIAGATYQEAEIRRLRGEYALAEESYLRASRLGLDPQPGLALLRLAQGDGAQAAASIRRALAATTEPLARTRILPASVEILQAIGAMEDARQACQQLEEIASRFASDILRAMAAQARGRVELTDGDPAAALSCFQAAISIWREVGAPYIEASLRMLSGMACRALSDGEGARLEFEAAYAVFVELGATPDVARLARLMSRGEAPPKALLTPREHEVLALVAKGETNRRIAAALGLSEKTVDRHVSNIFDKLAVSSRAAATAFALQNGLL
jgi:DNA-binding CsgD family transcriptional regulator